MRVSAAAESENAFYLGFGEIAMSVLPSENFDSIHGVMDLSLVQIMLKDVLANLRFFVRSNDGQCFGIFSKTNDMRCPRSCISTLNLLCR